mgnify:FL=1|jgi:hypothetical protein
MSCQSVKEGLAGKQRKGGDEFLVKKKNPLVKPKNFDVLPQPKSDEKITTTIESDVQSIEKLLKVENNKSSKNTGNASNLKSLEKTILEKINKN